MVAASKRPRAPRRRAIAPAGRPRRRRPRPSSTSSRVVRLAADDRDRQHHRRLLGQLLRRDADQAARRPTSAAAAAPPPARRWSSSFARGTGLGVHAVDGSGLTRTNRASPLQVVACWRRCAKPAVGDEFIHDLALTGHEGTVADRMHGTAADGRCRTKTARSPGSATSPATASTATAGS